MSAFEFPMVFADEASLVGCFYRNVDGRVEWSVSAQAVLIARGLRPDREARRASLSGTPER
jgi:hypothetical protein